MNEGHAEEDSFARTVSGENKRSARLDSATKWALRILAGLVAGLLLFLTLTPVGRYLARAGWEEGKILWRRRDIAEIVADTTVPKVTRAKLRIVLDARAFAGDSLGLRVGRSFTTYSPLERDTLVLVLSAAYKDRLAHHTWWFPIVGTVPYKGYFNFAAAQREERDFAERGFDTYLRPASAFSTLGWFNDPLVSTTLRSDTLSLANTVIHELTHNTFYASGRAEFNESFANFVGARGSRDFFRARGQRRAVEEADARWSDEKILARFWKQLHGDIDSAFKAHPGDAAIRARLALRDSIYRAARTDLVFRVGPMLRTVAPRYLERVRLDNAALLARRIYLTDLDLFDSVYVREKYDTRRATRRIIELAKSDSKRPYDALRRWISGRGAGGAKATTQ
jgi:predicted aminopeptidase